MGKVSLHDPNESIDYTFDWVDFLTSGETVSASSWRSSSTAITLSGASNTTRLTSTFATGGTPGDVVRLINKMTTDSVPARITERVRTLRIAQR